MSGPQPSNAGSSAPRTTGSNVVNGSMSMSAQPRSNENGLGNTSGGGSQGGTMSQQNLNQIVSQIYVPCQVAVHTIFLLRQWYIRVFHACLPFSATFFHLWLREGYFAGLFYVAL